MEARDIIQFMVDSTGKSRSFLAEQSGVSKGWVARVYKNERDPHYSILSKIAEDNNFEITIKPKNIEYISGIHALNLRDGTNTPGDWHRSALDWSKVDLRQSKKSPLGNWGIEGKCNVPNFQKKYYVANHIRALLDLVSCGEFAKAQGMNKNFIDNPDYDDLIFEKTSQLSGQDNWHDIYNFMWKEYGKKWRQWNESR
ncbi:MAG: helix-turn-helix domain-containing protein [Candidatus Ancillula sp.]|jgi:transcriptional regulator with XRE-family HTH domain|nr:helix-turn-helix domain-containing protein [Candidatus Ancillula sp.]